VTRLRGVHAREFGDPALAALHGLDRTFILEVPADTDTVAMAADFETHHDEVEFAEPDAFGTVAALMPDDESFWRQWGLHNTGQNGGSADADIDAPEAWNLHTGNLGTVTVAIIDTGITPHPEFEGRLLLGINVADPSHPDDTEDECDIGASITGHGTHVAGIVAAVGNNGIGVAGVTWGANLMPVRVFAGASPCGGFESTAAQGIIWAVDHGADICNISLQFPTGTQTLLDAVNYAYDNGVLVISAAGNNDYCGDGAVCFPARFPNSMAVSATTANDTLAIHSNSGDELDVCAPGDSIYSTYRTDPDDPEETPRYGYLNGTSMATPFVSGLAALMKSYSPDLTHDEIWTILTITADDLGARGWDDLYGHGRINAYDALLEAGPPRIVASSPPDGAIDARQPSEPDGSNPAGWRWVDATFAGDTAELTLADFAVTHEGGSGDPPSVADLYDVDENVVRLILDAKISVSAWTTITHVPSGTAIRLGYLPADVNGDGLSAPVDILALIDSLNGAAEPLPIWSTDIDRSGDANSADVLRVIDLLNGAEIYDPFLHEALP
jgi:subtilisin family serine protease